MLSTTARMPEAALRAREWAEGEQSAAKPGWSAKGPGIGETFMDFVRAAVYKQRQLLTEYYRAEDPDAWYPPLLPANLAEACARFMPST